MGKILAVEYHHTLWMSMETCFKH